MTEVSIIVPAYNEEEGIKETLEKINQVLSDRFKFEIIVVDDGSMDNTFEIAKAAGARVIKNPSNIGYGASLKRGIEAAQYEYLVTLDADGTYPVGKIPELIAKLEDGSDMAVGARTGKHYWAGLFLNPTRLIFKWLCEFVVGRKIPDVNSGLRAIRRSKILPFFPDLSNRFSFSTSSTMIFILKSYFVHFLPIEYYARKGKSKVRYIRDALKVLQLIATIVARYNPVKLFLAAILPIAPLSIVFLVLQQWSLAIISFYFIILAILLGFFATIFQR